MNVLRGNDKALACQAPFTLALVCLVQEDRVLLDSRLQIAFYNRGGTTRLGNSTRLESTHVSSFNSSLTRLVHQLENSQLDSTRFLISKLDNSTSDSNANALPKILKFTTYKMKYASLFFIFSYFFQVLMIFFHVT